MGRTRRRDTAFGPFEKRRPSAAPIDSATSRVGGRDSRSASADAQAQDLTDAETHRANEWHRPVLDGQLLGQPGEIVRADDPRPRWFNRWEPDTSARRTTDEFAVHGAVEDRRQRGVAASDRARLRAGRCPRTDEAFDGERGDLADGASAERRHEVGADD